jgi:hypothetical protein
MVTSMALGGPCPIRTSNGASTFAGRREPSRRSRCKGPMPIMGPDLLFTATDWPREPARELFDSADAELRRRAEAATDFHVHVDVSYGLLVQALDESRAEGSG